MKKWEVLAKFDPPQKDIEKSLIKLLLKNRKITPKEEKEFLKPTLNSLTPKNVGIDLRELSNSLKRIKEAIKNDEMVVVFGDYDVDGITGAAIIWETLSDLGVRIMPYIPHRIEEGYGLSTKGITNLKKIYPDISLIITVDNGIVANSAVDFANESGIDVIITDHHVPANKKPKAFSIVHSTQICGSAVGWMFSRYIEENLRKKTDKTRHIELVGLATVADVMGLRGANRTFLKFGIEELRKTKRIGLLALFEDGVIEKEKIGVYEIGHIIVPRLNASGRIGHGMDSLRLICTRDVTRAKELSQKLSRTNISRQNETIESFENARKGISKQKLPDLIYVSSEKYLPGVIGLVAGRLVEEFYRPAIVISKGKEISKGSARSISGFNIVEFIRSAKDLLVDVGGHPMAAGFSIETKKIPILQKTLENAIKNKLSKSLLTRSLKIDCVLPLEYVNENLFFSIQNLYPFGPSNPEPTFAARRVMIENMQLVGKGNKHLKISVSADGKKIDGIVFGFENTQSIVLGDIIDIAYVVQNNIWNGRNRIELRIRDFTLN